VSELETDARTLLQSLTGQEIRTIARGQPNRILGLDGDDVIIGTERTPAGQPVPLEEIQDALDRLASGEAVEVTVESLGHRSSFIGALLASLAETHVEDGPPVRVARRASDHHTPRQNNPYWTWDEEILAFDLYIREGLLSDGRPEVIELSDLLQELSIHPPESRTPTFRNQAGVARKLADIGTRDPRHPERKQTSGSRLDEEIWERFGDDPSEASALANEIRLGVRLGLEETVEEQEELARPEGRVVYVYRLHRRVERNRGLVERKKQAVRDSTGALACEACGFDFAVRYGEVGEGFAEVHHVRPLHLGEATTSLDDLVVLCANCHRIAHRMSELPTLEDLRSILR
jgi:predicted HNH restriction endonuclease